MPNIQKQSNFYNEIKVLLQSAKNKVYSTINITMTETYWLIGKKQFNSGVFERLRLSSDKLKVKEMTLPKDNTQIYVRER